MVLLKRLFAMVLAGLILSDEGSTPTDRNSHARNRMICLRQIHRYFPGLNVFDHAIHAMENYTLESQLEFCAMFYYRKFELFLLEGEMRSPNEFCHERYDRIYCRTIVKNTFGDITRVALYNAMYRTNKQSLEQYQNTRDEHLWEYFNEILNSFNLLSDYFGTPATLCVNIFQYFDEDESEEVDDGSYAEDENSEQYGDRYMDPEAEELTDIFNGSLRIEEGENREGNENREADDNSESNTSIGEGGIDSEGRQQLDMFFRNIPRTGR